ncbi:MAG: glycogen/starch synthase [Chitinophagaceae bacterium]|jgi:starch synthase|nr:glycogen/starch synthase [Chitinophagaceae bacterium]MCE2972766.1 glycogen/starch synthase [Sediminibacterium sp.]MCA6490077.1 glycogen/starch synthase [Chitinophagaceae bacterium]MCA6492184.1 glycogen/starch synthase [Chitinophagaceae bacterium]MCA6498859.1 glycogen/starch synthase [Chitinophagaceae bacterium]
MEIVHLSAECYPVAKAGGLGDVVGALPKYQCKAGHIAKVVMPMYRTPFLYNHEWSVDFKGHANLANWYFDFTVIKEKHNTLGYDLYLIDINGLLDRQKIYGYDDDTERFTAFQIAALTWMKSWEHRPDVVHCHDYHTGLTPFIMRYAYDFQALSGIKTIFTIHNAQYQGWMTWDKSRYIPRWDLWKRGMLEWANNINPLASAVKCCDRVTTVSQSYLEELKFQSNGLEKLFEYERGKCVGILNGIDNEVWNPATDNYLQHHFSITSVTKGKEKNKELLCHRFGFDLQKPLIVFIGRLVGEKAAELLPDAIAGAIYQFGHTASYLILGSGEHQVEGRLTDMLMPFSGTYNAVIGYDEKLSHLMYAGADFLLMPSRVEPCGLNQMYAMRYGTVPMVRSTGGLKDTVVDMGETEGFGIRFDQATAGDIIYSIGRAIQVYRDKNFLLLMRERMMQIDHSWENTVQQYDQVYQS